MILVALSDAERLIQKEPLIGGAQNITKPLKARKRKSSLMKTVNAKFKNHQSMKLIIR